eukprot:jgi/Botrbrau1/5088/Bobra.37_1s0050.1
MTLTTLGAFHLGNSPDLTNFPQHNAASGRATTTHQKPLGIGQQSKTPSGSTQGPQLNAINADLVFGLQSLDRSSMRRSRSARFAAAEYEAGLGRPADHGAFSPLLMKWLDTEVDPRFLQIDNVMLSNLEIDKLVSHMGGQKSLSPRILDLFEWLRKCRHTFDDRLCTTFIRHCSQHGDPLRALEIYDWMKARLEQGDGLVPSVFTYTAVIRACHAGNMVDKAFKVWDDAAKAGCQPDCRMCTAMIEVCTRKEDVARAMQLYELMRDAHPNSKLAPGVYAYTAAMRAATEGDQWERALQIWDDMKSANCIPTGHAYAAAISACAAGRRSDAAYELFQNMVRDGIKADVVSCTALISALASDGRYTDGREVITWMQKVGVRPNVRTYTALMVAMCNAKQWDKALALLQDMKKYPEYGPNAYTYAALFKAFNQHGKADLAEKTFKVLELQAREARAELSGRNRSALDDLGQRSWPFPAGPALWAAPDNVDDPAQVNAGWARSGISTSVRSKVFLKTPLNEVVCGLMMQIYGRSGDWMSAVGMLDRARAVGITPNTIMYNTALYALVRAGRFDDVESLFQTIPQKDVATYQTAMLASAARGNYEKTEKYFSLLRAAGFVPQDYAFCALIVAYSMGGDCTSAWKVRDRMVKLNHRPTVFVYNQLLLALERAKWYPMALNVYDFMREENIKPNEDSIQLFQVMGQGGVTAVQNQQMTLAALSACLAAAGSAAMKAGLW